MKTFKIYIFPLTSFLLFITIILHIDLYDLNDCTMKTSYDCSGNTPHAQTNAEYYTKGFIYKTENDLFLS
jgi:hypothetical protein